MNLVVFLVFAKQGFQHLAKNSQKYMLTLPTTSLKAKSYSSCNSTRRCKASQARQKLSIKSSKLKIINHKNTYTCILLLEKLQVTKLLVGQGNMVTLALVRRRVGALVTKALVALSTIYTQNIAS
jgi:hypothetical protein